MHLGKAFGEKQILAWAIGITAIQTVIHLTHPLYSHYITAAAALLLAAAVCTTYRGRTSGGWVAHRHRSTRRIPRLAQIISSNNTAILWDHTRNHASIVIEITQKPFTVHISDQQGTWSTPTLDLDPIRRELRQFDITLHDQTLTTVGYTYARQDAVARVAFANTGPINALGYGRTYLRVTLDMWTSLDSIDARKIDQFNDPRQVLTSGLVRTIQIASSRTHRAICQQGFLAKKLSRQEAMDLHTAVAALFTPAIKEEGFRQAGTTAPHLVAFTPTDDSAKTHSTWLHSTTEPCATITRLTPHNDTTDHIEQLYVNKVARRDTVALAEANNLRREYGQHAAIATTALPLAVPPPVTAVPGRLVDRGPSAAAGNHYTVGGTGIYLGHTRSGTKRVWIDITVASAEPLWLIGPPEIVDLFLIRASTLGLLIDVRDPRLSATRHALRDFGVGTHPHPDLALTDRRPPRNADPSRQAPVTVIWSPDPVPDRPDYYIAATEPAILRVHTPQTDVDVRWELSAAESALLPQAITR